MNLSDREEAIDQFTVGQWTISTQSGMLSNGLGEELYLEPRLAQLFYLLSRNSNKLVSRKQLIEQIWRDTIVNEESLTRAISDLRKVLKAHFDNPPRIKTLPKRGYTMIVSAPVVKRMLWKKIVTYIVYGLMALILLILVVRGLNY